MGPPPLSLPFPTRAHRLILVLVFVLVPCWEVSREKGPKGPTLTLRSFCLTSRGLHSIVFIWLALLCH